MLSHACAPVRYQATLLKTHNALVPTDGEVLTGVVGVAGDVGGSRLLDGLQVLGLSCHVVYVLRGGHRVQHADLGGQ